MRHTASCSTAKAIASLVRCPRATNQYLRKEVKTRILDPRSSPETGAFLWRHYAENTRLLYGKRQQLAREEASARLIRVETVGEGLNETNPLCDSLGQDPIEIQICATQAKATCSKHSPNRPRASQKATVRKTKRTKRNANARKKRPCSPAVSWSHTTRLLLDDDGWGLRIGMVTDMSEAFEQQRASYTPMKSDQVLRLDLGLTTLLATDDGELHGRGWLNRPDQILTAIARQRLGLRLKDNSRYRAKV